MLKRLQEMLDQFHHCAHDHWETRDHRKRCERGTNPLEFGSHDMHFFSLVLNKIKRKGKTAPINWLLDRLDSPKGNNVLLYCMISDLGKQHKFGSQLRISGHPQHFPTTKVCPCYFFGL
jgi:hypothetical protein